jgi:large subunit ribosomal protein L9
MRVILKEVVPNLGDAGDIVNVKPGYGRNFLIPRGLAMPASEGSVRQMQHQQRVADNIRKKQLVAAEELAGKIKDVAVTIRKKLAKTISCLVQ